MATSRSAKKRIRQTRKSRATNRQRKHVLKTGAKVLQGLIDEKNVVQAETAFKELQSKLDKTAKTGTIHKNKASRRKSRLAKRLNALKKAAGESKA